MAVALASKPSAYQNGAWVTLASALSMMLIAGTIYGFGAWSTVLKSKDGYALNQFQVELLALAGHLGNYMVLDTGVLVSRMGSVPAFAAGCSYACLGYFGLWLAIEQFPGRVPFSALAFCCFLYGHGCGSIDNATMSQLLADFSSYKGYVVGCTKAYYGLATAIVVTIHNAAFPSSPTNFLLFLAVYSLGAGLLMTPIIWKTKGQVDEPRPTTVFKFRMLACFILAFSIFFFTVQIWSQHMTQQGWRYVLLTVFFGALTPFLLANTTIFNVMNRENEEDVTLGITQAVLDHPVDISGVDMLSHLDFYIFMAILTAAQGAGLLFIGNAAQILPSMEGGSRSPAVFVAVISIFNSFGRLFFGSMSEMFRHRINRPWFLCLSIGILSSSYLAMYLSGPDVLWAAAVFVGFGYGGLWGIQPSMALELFGPRDYGFKYSCTCLAALGGSLFFSTLLAGRLYDIEAERLGTSPHCLQPSCFRLSFLVTAACGMPAMVCAIWLARRSANVYSKTLEFERHATGYGAARAA